MSPEKLLKTFELCGDSPETLTLYRQFVLNLAIFGKLNASGERVDRAELLRCIRAAKKKTPNLSGVNSINVQRTVDPDDVPVEGVPVTNFACLSEIAQIEKGNIGIQKATPGQFPLVGLSENRSTCNTFQFDAKAAIVPMISSTGHGHASMKRLHYQEGKFALANILCAAIPYAPALTSARFLFEYLSAYKEKLLVSKMVGTANVSLTLDKIASCPIPIVAPSAQARVDELMRLCDELEAAQTKRERRRDRLVAATLHGLNNGEVSTEPGEGMSFQETARFYFSHLPRLTTRPEHIQQFRDTILSLAVRGRLVPQLRSDGQASALLAEVKNAQKSRGGKKTYLPELANGDVPFSVPENWEWVPLNNILDGDTQNGYSKRPDDLPSGIPILRISAGTTRKDAVIAEEEHKFISEIEPRVRTKFSLQKGDLLACRFNGNRSFVGRLSLFTNYMHLDPIYPDKLIRVRVFGNLTLPALLRYFFNSPLIRREIEKYCETTVGNWGISATDLRRTPIPLPPLAEQHRILAKVNNLMSVCDHLQSALSIGESTRAALLEATLKETVS